MDNSENNTSLTTIKPRQAPMTTEGIRAIEETRAKMIMAREFPRDEIDAEQRIIVECKRFSLADIAFYTFPRGGKTVTGPSVRLLEVVSQEWGHISAGYDVLSIENGEQGPKAIVRCYAHDLQRNTHNTRTLIIDLKIKLKHGGMKVYDDPRDQQNHIASYAVRGVRECLRATMPRWIVNKAEAVCRATLAEGIKAEPLIDRVRKMVHKFAELGVSKELIEKRLNHSVDMMLPPQLVEFHGIYNSIKDGAATREEFFQITTRERQGTSSSLNEQLGLTKAEQDADDVAKEIFK